MSIEIPLYTCHKCGHVWAPRKSIVKLCPKCQSPKWDANTSFQNVDQSSNLTGMHFDNLTVVAPYEINYKKDLWLCKCICGNELSIKGRLLRNHFIHSCGCIKKRGAFWPKYEYGLLFNSCRNRAKQKGIPFELNRKHFLELLLSPCHYCGSALNIGVNRKNPHIGYTLDNSVAACRICSRGKSNDTEEEFMRYILHVKHDNC